MTTMKETLVVAVSGILFMSPFAPRKSITQVSLISWKRKKPFLLIYCTFMDFFPTGHGKLWREKLLGGGLNECHCQLSGCWTAAESRLGRVLFWFRFVDCVGNRLHGFTFGLMVVKRCWVDVLYIEWRRCDILQDTQSSHSLCVSKSHRFV